MIPHIALQILTTTADSVRLTYHCAACGKDSPAIVSAVSRGFAEAHYFIGQQQAREQSAAQAAAGLPAAIRRTVGLAGCPHCAGREPSAVRSGKLGAIVAAMSSWLGVLASVALLIGAIAVFASALLFGAAFLAGGLLVILPLAAWKYTKIVREAATLVVWEGHEPPPGAA